MNISKRIKAIIVAGVLSLALVTPMFTPVGSVVPGSTMVSVQAKNLKLTKKAALKRLKKRIRKGGHKKTYKYKYMGFEDGYYVFYIYSCKGNNCSAIGYGEVNKKSGKIHYKFGV